VLEEPANLVARTGDAARFIASVECGQALHVGNGEGLVFPAHQVTGRLVLLAELSEAQLDALYEEERFRDRPGERPAMAPLRTDLAHIRRRGLAVDERRSECGVVAIGRPVRRPDGSAAAGIWISRPGVRYDPKRLRSYGESLGAAGRRGAHDRRARPLRRAAGTVQVGSGRNVTACCQCRARHGHRGDPEG